MRWHQQRKRNEQRTLVDQSKWSIFADTKITHIIRQTRIPVISIWQPDIDRLRKTLNSYLQTHFNQVVVNWFQDIPGIDPHKANLCAQTQALFNLGSQRNVTVNIAGINYDASISPGHCVCVHPASRVYTSIKSEANGKEGVLLAFNQF
jgi:endonuclease V-like protein UPF0215 family